MSINEPPLSQVTVLLELWNPPPWITHGPHARFSADDAPKYVGGGSWVPFPGFYDFAGC